MASRIGDGSTARARAPATQSGDAEQDGREDSGLPPRRIVGRQPAFDHAPLAQVRHPMRISHASREEVNATTHPALFGRGVPEGIYHEVPVELRVGGTNARGERSQADGRSPAHDVAPTPPQAKQVPAAPLQPVIPGSPISAADQAKMVSHVTEIFAHKLKEAGLGPKAGQTVTNPCDPAYFANFTDAERARVPAILDAAQQEVLRTYGLNGANALGGANFANQLLGNAGIMFSQQNAMLQFEMEMAKAFTEILKAVGKLIADAARSH